MELRRITHDDAEGQAAFVAFVPRVFRTTNFAPWCEAGEWDANYAAYALFEGATIVANASVMHMTIVVDGNTFTAAQFGAVGCLPTHRGRGFAQLVMGAALDALGETPSFLFANPDVRAFYPRFGFEPQAQSTYRGTVSYIPSTQAARLLDADERLSAIKRACAAAPASTTLFGASDYGRAVSWYVLGADPPKVHAIDDETVAITRTQGAALQLLDAFSPTPIDIEALVPRLIDRPIDAIEFGFAPPPSASLRLTCTPDPSADLFVRGFPPLPPGSQFPVLART